MKNRHLLALMLVAVAFVPAAFAAENPWNGTWVLDANRSSPGMKDNAAEDYRFTILPDGQITWEIPSLEEVVKGKIDGQPMVIHRHGKDAGLTLAVHPDGPRVLIYKVAGHGRPDGEGRMTLVDNGKAWVDISWPSGHPEVAGQMVYIKKLPLAQP
jgi:hypothetical protein